ncbi:hypothetical protein FBU30_004982 [Linnemannia zychae]|nr:hypothetical protein FBU30_004982 [Linnemannia zychae]
MLEQASPLSQSQESLETAKEQKTDHGSLDIFSQSIPSEMEVQLYSDSDNDEAYLLEPMKNSNCSIDSTSNPQKSTSTANMACKMSNEDYAIDEDISPIVMTQSSIPSNYPDWPLANQAIVASTIIQDDRFAESISSGNVNDVFDYSSFSVNSNWRYESLSDIEKSNTLGLVIDDYMYEDNKNYGDTAKDILGTERIKEEPDNNIVLSEWI